ncbi:MAG: methyltransferase domain-containing protein [Pseudomonadota bacterium]
MAHPQQQAFCLSVKARFPQYFSGAMALDIGSLDINGNNHTLFDETTLYLGVDVAVGRNVDVVTPAHRLLLPDATFDTVVSTECLEHDRHWVDSLRNAVRMLRPGGLMVITCATTGRPEHGTRRTTPHDAPLLMAVDDDWADYYRNLDEADIRAALDVPGLFQLIEFSVGEETHDLYFFALKHGVFEKRNNRSSQVESRPANAELAQLRLHSRRVANDLSKSLATIRAREGELARLYESKSWRATAPLRAIMTRLGVLTGLLRRGRNLMRYVVRADFAGLRNRWRSIRVDQALQNLGHGRAPERWAVMTTPHTLFLGHLIAARLRALGWQAEVLSGAPTGFPHDMYIVVCPQMFKILPPGPKRIVYQMEQSVSSRWFTDSYFKILENSLAVLDYSLINIEFLAAKGIAYPNVYYLPVGADRAYRPATARPAPCCEVLFYGDANSSPRRRAMLTSLSAHFKVQVCSEMFGAGMIDQIRSARVVINLHYYEDALLEMPRIQECLSLGVPVVSEAARDQGDYPELAGAVSFFEAGNHDAMVEAVRLALSAPAAEAALEHAVARGAQRFGFMFDRFLVAMGLVSAGRLVNHVLPIPADASRIALSLPETITRRRIFQANRPAGCAVFDGVRLRPGWVGCGLSYLSLARHALRYHMQRLTVIEDDALLPPDFEQKMAVVKAYLDAREGSWDVFAGVIASLHADVKVLEVEVFQGVRFVTVDRMTSMVCNIYSESALRLLAAWDPDHRDDQVNTIDKYLERQVSLRVIVALPFLVGHREEVFSTLWGFQNSQYRELIQGSEQTLLALASEHSRTALVA